MIFEERYLCVRTRSPEVNTVGWVPITLAYALEHETQAKSLPANHTIDCVLIARRGVTDNGHIAHIVEFILTTDTIVDVLTNLTTIIQREFPSTVAQRGIIGLWSISTEEIWEVHTRTQHILRLTLVDVKTTRNSIVHKAEV